MIEITNGINVKVGVPSSRNGYIYNDVDITIYKDDTSGTFTSYQNVDVFELNDGSINIYDYDKSELVIVDKYLPKILEGFNIKITDTNHRHIPREKLKRDYHKISKLRQGTKNQIVYKI